MKRIDSRMLWGSLLIVAGLIILVHNFTGILDYFSEFIWAMLFIIGGGLFIYVFLSNREQWWAAIPGFTLLGIGALIGLEWVWPTAASAVGGVLVTGGIAVAFLVIFLTHQEHWWAIIPGGSMMTISLMIVAEPLIGGDAVASLFFFGLSATFGLIYLLPTGGQRQLWAIYPAIATLAMSLFLLGILTPLGNLIWPLALIIGGGYLILRTMGPMANNKDAETYEQNKELE